MNFQFDCEERMSPFNQWIGQPVILQVEVENTRSTLEGTIIGDTLTSLHFQAKKGRRILVIPKTCVLAVEEAPRLIAYQSRRRRWEMPLAS
jgi:RNase P/RNase MRP subunit p29